MSREPIDPTLAKWLQTTKRQVRRAKDRSSAILRCRYDAPVEDVWRALTQPSLLERWFAKVSGTMQESANLTFDVGAPCRVSSQVRRSEVNRTLAFTWAYPGRVEDDVEIRLTSDGEGTELELEQRSNDTSEWWFGAGAGWESALVRLCLLLKGEDPRRISDQVFDDSLGPLWKEAGRRSPIDS